MDYNMFYAKDWVDYELLDTGGGEKLERWGTIVLRRPDPQIIWPLQKETPAWRQADAHYHRSSSGGGQWQQNAELPERCMIRS
jgi:23S rRNA (cytosine1962-C5)-methyltransferase